MGRVRRPRLVEFLAAAAAFVIAHRPLENSRPRATHYAADRRRNDDRTSATFDRAMEFYRNGRFC